MLRRAVAQREPSHGGLLGSPEELKTAVIFCILAAIHGVLGVVLNRNGPVVLLHGIVTVAVSIWVALRGNLRATMVALAYVTGCEVYWRLARAPLPWEFGKYATLGIVLAYIAPRPKLLQSVGGWLYFLPLLPSAIVEASAAGWDEASDHIRFHMSGPLSMAVLMVLFSRLRPSKDDVLAAFRAVAISTSSIIAVCFTSVIKLQASDFANVASREASGRMGPNQVSGALSLALVCCVLHILMTGTRLNVLSIALGVVAGGAAVQGAFTFSRGGVYIAALVIAAVIARLWLTGRSTKGLAVLTVGGGVFVVGLVTYLNAFTDGRFSERFSNTSTTGRWEILLADLVAWFENPLFGTGPGLADEYHRRSLGIHVTAHTEYTRMLAEHGVFGLLSLVALGLIVYVQLTRERSELNNMVRFVGWWGIGILSIYGFRTVSAAWAVALGMGGPILESRFGDARPAKRRVRADLPEQPSASGPRRVPA